jgi:ABC-2 type transport system permease protein
MVRKEVMRIVRIWSQTLLAAIVTTTLYFIVFGTFIGSQLKPVRDTRICSSSCPAS